MSGTLYHSRAFSTQEYLAGDGQIHYEVRCLDGESLAISHACWRAIKELAAMHGMPESVWPEFPGHDFGVDVPLDTVREKQLAFADQLTRLPEGVLTQHYWLERIAVWVDRSEAVFFCGN